MISKTILTISLAIVIVGAMGASQVLATSPAFTLDVDNTDGNTISTIGNIGTATMGHAVVVYAIVTDEAPENDGDVVAYLATVHPSFNDNPEQSPGNKAIHGHKVELVGDNLCVVYIDNSASLSSVTKKSVTIEGIPDGVNPVLYAIAGYDVTDEGLCLTQLYDGFEP